MNLNNQMDRLEMDLVLDMDQLLKNWILFCRFLMYEIFGNQEFTSSEIKIVDKSK